MENANEPFLVQIKTKTGWKDLMTIPITVSVNAAKNAALWDGLGESRYLRYVRVVGPPKVGRTPYSIWAEWKDGSLIKMKGQFNG